MRSAALGIEHLRGLERHGGAFMMERAFSGFTALPPPKGHWDTLGIAPDSQAHGVERAFRRKAMTAHPDQGGSDDAMAEAQPCP
jgi:hypothetical protein